MEIRKSDFDAVAFDFDGTLADTIGAHTEARVKAFPMHGITSVTPEQHRLAHRLGNRPETIIAGTLKLAAAVPPDADPNSDPLVQKVVKTKNELYRQSAQAGLPEHPGATAFFRKMIAEKGIDNVYIVTSATAEELQPFLKRYDMESLAPAHHRITAETIEQLSLQPKPAGDPYLEAARRIGIDPARLLVIEDSTGGIESAKRAASLALAMGTTNPQNIFDDPKLAFHPDYFAPSFHDIELC